MQIGIVNSEGPGRTKIIKSIISSPGCVLGLREHSACWEGVVGLCLSPVKLYVHHLLLLLQGSLADGAPAFSRVEGQGIPYAGSSQSFSFNAAAIETLKAGPMSSTLYPQT